MSAIPTTPGSTVELEKHHGTTWVILANEAAPVDLRRVTVGRLIGAFFQPTPHQPAYAISAAGLRQLADLMDERQNSAPH